MSKLLGALNGLTVLHGGDDAAVRARVVAVAALREKTRSSAVVTVGSNCASTSAPAAKIQVVTASIVLCGRYRQLSGGNGRESGDGNVVGRRW